MVKINIELLEGGVIPVKSTEGAAALDCFAREVNWDRDKGYIQVPLGFKMEIPEGYCAKLFPRSSVSNLLLHLANSVGIIDSDYRGEVAARFYPSASIVSRFSNIQEFESHMSNAIKAGDRVAQIRIEKNIDFVFEQSESNLSDSARGEGGFGSTGA